MRKKLSIALIAVNFTNLFMPIAYMFQIHRFIFLIHLGCMGLTFILCLALVITSRMRRFDRLPKHLRIESWLTTLLTVLVFFFATTYAWPSD